MTVSKKPINRNIVWIVLGAMTLGILGAVAYSAAIMGLMGIISPVPASAGEASAAAVACPVSYSNPSKPFLFGGLNDASCKGANGQPCPARSAKWAAECRDDPNIAKFPNCDSNQFQLGYDVASKLNGGAALKASPCNLYPYLAGRTLWLIGDSHTKQIYRSLQCFLIDLWPGQVECKPSADARAVASLNDLPLRPGEAKCFNLVGDGRVCFVHAILGTTLLNNNAVASGGVLPLLREKFADPKDIFVVQFGPWHAKEGPPGLERMRAAMVALGEDYQKNKGKWPHLIFRESPMTHAKSDATKTCLPALAGWTYDGASGKLSVASDAKSDRVALLARGGELNAPAREVFPGYGIPVMGGYDPSVPLHAAHIGTRGVKELDCLHYCSAGLPEIITYELLRTFQAGAAGVKPLSPAPAASVVRPCTPL